jgi:hypothetical protein
MIPIRQSDTKTLHLDLSPELEAQLQQQANAGDVSLETLAGEVLQRAAGEGADSVAVESVLREEHEEREREDVEIERILMAWPDRMNDTLTTEPLP